MSKAARDGGGTGEGAEPEKMNVCVHMLYREQGAVVCVVVGGGGG